MKKKVILLSLWLVLVGSFSIVVVKEKQVLWSQGSIYLHQYLSSKLQATLSNQDIELNTTYQLGPNHTIDIEQDENENLVITEKLDQELWSSVEQLNEGFVVNSYKQGIINKSETYNQAQLVEEHFYDNEGVVKLSLEYTGYSTIETKYADGQPTSLTETNRSGVSRVGEYLDGKLSKEIYYTSIGTISEVKLYDQNQLITKSETYDINGTITSRSEYQRGIITKSIDYYEDSPVVEAVNTYQAGVKAESSHYNQAGVLTNQFTYYTTGSERGLVELNESYDQSQVKRKENHFATNGQVDQRKIYTTDGIIENYYNYNDSKLESEYIFDEEGIKTDFISYYPDMTNETHIYYQDGIPIKSEVFNQRGVIEALNIYKSDGKTYAKTTRYVSSGQATGKIKSVETYYQDINVIKQIQIYDTNQKLETTQINNRDGDKQSLAKFEDETIVSKSYYNAQGEVTEVDYFDQGKISETIKYNPNSSYEREFYLDGKLARTDYYNKNGIRYKVVSHLKTSKLKGYDSKTVDTCDMTTTRSKNVVVDVGVDTNYANRDYYAYTNNYGQLVRVDAAQIIAQNETYEDMVWGLSGIGSEERYCLSEAQVIGSEPLMYDRGHVIADSLGGAANAYNITPEVEEINVSGGQAKMEQMIRSALSDDQLVTDFSMKISYSDTNTNIPEKYEVKFKIDGVEHKYTQKNE